MLRPSSSSNLYNRKKTSSDNKALTYRQGIESNIKLQHYTGRMSQQSCNKTKQNHKQRNQMQYNKKQHNRRKSQQKQANSTLPNKSSLTSIPIQSNSSLITCIDYSNNKISSIQKDLSKLYTSLTIINLSHNLLSNMQPLCYFYDLKELILSFNLINLVPKQVKYLNKLQVLDISQNKFWYLNQITALKQLIKIRTQDKKQCIQVYLSGNLVLKTNQKAIQKLICLDTFNCYPKKQKNDQIRQFVNTKLDLEQYKQNICPNKQNIFSCNPNNEPFTKTMKTKSLNQSLMDISSIMYNGQPSTNNFQFKSSNIPLNSELIEKQFQNKQNQIQSYQQIIPIVPIKQNQKNESSSKFLQSIGKISKHDKKISKEQVFTLLFKKYENFGAQFIFPAQKFIKELKQLEKKLKLCQKIQGVPQNLEKQFSSLNYDVLMKINRFQQLLLPFENFFEHNIPLLSLNIQNQLKNLKGSEFEINDFHQKTLQSYLNSDKCAQIKWYEVWINQYELFQNKSLLIQNFLNSFIQLWKKISKLERVTNLFHQGNVIKDVEQGIEKNIVTSKGLFSSKKETQKKQLNNLLFSQSKYKKTSLFCSEKKQSLLLSQKNSRSSVKQLPQYFQKYPQNSHDLNSCLQCPIKNQQVLVLNKRIQEQQHKNNLYEQQVIELQKKIEQLEKQTELKEKLLIQQTEIISQVGHIKPSTYQNLLLTQAITIENLINMQSSSLVDQRLLQGYEKLQDLPQEKNLDKDFGQTCDSCGNPVNCQKYLKNLKYGVDQQFMDHQNPSSKNQIIYTQISDQSKTKIKNSDRTYFKSNGTQPFSQTRPNDKCRQRTSFSPMSKMSTKKFSLTHEHRQEGKYCNFNKMNPSSSNRQSYSKDHVQPFQKIVIAEFLEDGTLQNRHTKINPTNLQSDKQIKNSEKQIYLNSQTHNFETHEIYNRIHQNNLSSHRPAESDFSKHQNNRKISMKSGLKNNFQSLLLSEKQYFAVGYNYKNIQIEEKIDYQNYIKHHLRNNIRQILEKKNTLTLQNQKDQRISQLQEKNNKNKLSNPKRHSNDQKGYQTITKKSRDKGMKSCCDIKKKSQRKYILKSWDTDGK